MDRFGLRDAKPLSTPLAAHFKFSAILSLQTDEGMNYMAYVPYSSVVGNIMCAMVCTHPDISKVISVVSRYISCLSKGHYQAVK